MFHDRENIENEINKKKFLENANKNEKLLNWLRSWKLKHNISHCAMSELLRQLYTYDHVDLPKDARTLLGTPKINPVEILAPVRVFFITI